VAWPVLCFPLPATRAGRWLALGLGSLALGLTLAGTPASSQDRSRPRAMPEGPVAYLGHGAMFDRDGNEIAPTPEFIERA
jgi:hypothetical protein